MSFETQVTEISSDKLDELFGQIPTADDLSVGKDENQSDDEEKIETDEIKLPSENDGVIEEISEEDLENIENEEVQPSNTNSVLKNTVNYLIEQGIWNDFEGRDSIEITDEVYAELASKQAQHAAYDIVNELIDSTGEYGKAIIGYIKSGGNPDEIIDLFKEQKEVEQIDISTENGKLIKIEKYYEDIIGRKKEWVKKHLNRLVENDEVDSEFEDINDLYNKHYQEKLKEKQEAVKEQERQNAEKQNRFISSIKSSLENNNKLTQIEKKQIASSILDFKHTLDNGQKVNDFYVKFAEIQNDPEQYIELVQFVMDKNKYKERLKTAEKTKASKELFSFIKGNSAVNKKTNNIESTESGSRNTQKRGTDFSFVIKK